jgi:hypothetical protein
MARFPAVPGLAISLLLLLAGCRKEEGHRAAYRLSDPAPFDVRYEAVLEAGADGFRAARGYGSQASARLSMAAEPDSATGSLRLALSADSIAFRASDRDEEESRYMVERLKRYKARLVLTAAGQVLALEEEPDLPPVDFSPLNFGRFLVYGLPAFPDTSIREGSVWRIEQPLLDKFHPGSRLVKTFRAEAIRQTPEGRVLECGMDVEAWLEEDLDPEGSAPGDGTGRAALAGRGKARFNLDSGAPISTDLELTGRFLSRIRDRSAAAADHPIRLELRLDLRFGR